MSRGDSAELAQARIARAARIGPKLRRGIAIAALLAPAFSVIVVLFGGGLLNGLIVSLGYLPVIGKSHFSLDAYRRIFSDPGFIRSLLLTLYIAVMATTIAAIAGVSAAMALRGRGKRLSTWLLQVPITVPYLVAAVGIVMLVSQSGLIARVAVAMGLMTQPSEFPALVYDHFAVGIILTYVWKETPFFALIVLAALRGQTAELEHAARTLGANRWQCFWHVTLPRIAPSVAVAGVLIFAFTFGAFEIPFLLGQTYPKTLPVLAYNAYRSIDLGDRATAMATAMIIAAVTGVLAILYFRLSGKLSDA